MSQKDTYIRNTSKGLSAFILAVLGSARSSRRFRQLLNSEDMRSKNSASVRSTLNRLQSRGYVSSINKEWQLTCKGRDRLRTISLHEYTPSPFTEKSRSNTLISFDIPEHSKAKRNWLRNQIKIFGYSMLQKSLWLGPGPLPKVFIERLKDLGIKENIKIFKISVAKK